MLCFHSELFSSVFASGTSSLLHERTNLGFFGLLVSRCFGFTFLTAVADLFAQGDEMFCVTPEKLLFNDLSPEEAAKWAKKLSCHPSRGWDGVVDYVGWKKVPSVYLVSEVDALLSEEMQLDFAKRAASEIERCSAGHCLMIGQPERCLEVVRKAAGEVL